VADSAVVTGEVRLNAGQSGIVAKSGLPCTEP